MSIPKKYIGWISNIQGELFFHLFNPYGFRYDKTIGEIFFANERGQRRFIFWSALLDFRDSLYNNEFFFEECIGIFIAQKRKFFKKNYLLGKFFIIPYEKLYEKKEKKIKKLIEKSAEKKREELLIEKENHAKLIKLLEDLRNDIVNKNYNYKKLIEKIKEINNFTIEVNIVILHNGLIQLKLIPSSQLIIDKNNSLYSLALNIFIVIKSLFHKDRFHNKKSEHVNLLIKKTSSLTDDLKSLIYFLQRYIAEERKRNEHFIVSENLLGVVAYLKTLLEIANNYIKDEKYYNKKKNFIKNLNEVLLHEKEKSANVKPWFDLIKSSFIISASFLGVYNILHINALSPDKIKEKEAIFNSFFPHVIEYFIIFLLVVIFYEYIRFRAIPFSLSSEKSIFYFLYSVSNYIYYLIIKYSNPILSNNFFKKRFFPAIARFFKKRFLQRQDPRSFFSRIKDFFKISK